MANPSRGEVPLVLFEDDPNLERRSYTLKFSNAGHRDMEDFLDLERSEIVFRIFGDSTDATGASPPKLGQRLLTGMLWGATKKFHRRELPTIADIDEIFDLIEDEAEDGEAEGEKLGIALFAAYTKSNPSEVEAEFIGEEPSASGTQSSRGEGPKDQDKPKRKPKQKTPASGESS